MVKLKTKVIKYMSVMSAILFVLIMFISAIITINSSRANAKKDARDMFLQIGRVLDDNEIELDYAETAYRRNCISNAQTLAYMLQYNPKAADDINELKEMAIMTEVDEINIFDKSGTIVKGTVPEYYGYTVDSGEQISFFKQMLYDHSLELVQDITPNTAENKLMQYSAVWSKDKKYIIQIGMEPDNVIRITQKNEISYIFSLLNTSTGIDLYAIDHDTGVIKGATKPDLAGKKVEDIGIDLDEITTSAKGFDTVIDGIPSFCLFTRIDNLRIGYVVSNRHLYAGVISNMIVLGVSLILISVIMVFVVTENMNKYVIKSIYEINSDLSEILEGNLQKDVEVKGSIEFEELSEHINDVIQSILATTDKMSYVLNKTDMRIGVYEYNDKMKKVRYTDYVPDILDLGFKELGELSSDREKFKSFMSELKQNLLDGEEDVFVMKGIENRYIKLEEVKSGNDTFGILIDMTTEIEKRLSAETDRDIDTLTGLYNRRGINEKLTKLFEEPDELGYGAMIMIDADFLKEVNDNFGHESGDEYLIAIGKLLKSFGQKKNFSGRLGGDEYVMFLYGYNTERELIDDLNELTRLQDSEMLTLENGKEIRVSFSVGYGLSYGQTDYHLIMRNADEKMYKNKELRKTGR